MGHYHNKRRPPSLLAAAVVLAVFLLMLTVTVTADSRRGNDKIPGNNKDATRARRSVLGGSLPINPWMTDIRSVLAEVKRFQDEKNGSGKTGQDVWKMKN